MFSLPGVSPVTVDPVGAAPITVTDLTGAGRGTAASGGGVPITLGDNNVIDGARVLGSGGFGSNGINALTSGLTGTIRNAIIEGFSAEGINIDDGGTFVIEDTLFNLGAGLSEGIDARSNPTPLSLVIQRCDFQAAIATTVGASIRSQNGGAIVSRISECTANSNGNAGQSFMLNLSVNNAGSTHETIIENNNFVWDSTSSIINFDSSALSDGVSFAFDIRGNTISNPGAGSGMIGTFVSIEAGTPSSINGYIRNNSEISGTIFGAGLSTDLKTTRDVCTIAVQDNLNITGSDTAFDLFAETTSGAEVSDTQVLRNTHAPAVYNPAVGSFVVRVDAAYTGDLCTQLNGNNIVTGGGVPVRGIQLDNDAATVRFQINGPDGATLSAANNSIGVEDIGTNPPDFQPASFTCPSPVIP